MPETLHESVVMGGEEHARALALQRKEQVQQAAGGGGIHAAGRLVSKNEARTGDDRPSNSNALPLAARETVRQSPLPPGKTDPAQKLLPLGPRLALVAPSDAQRQADILQRREPGHEAEVLKDQP